VADPARRPAAASADSIRRLESAALQRNAGEFTRALEQALGIARPLAERMTHDSSGEPVVVAARALGMTADVLQRILLILNPTVGQSVARVYELARLFDELTPAAAGQMLAIWQRAQPRGAARHEPATYDDERRTARSLATHERRRTARGGEATPVRSRSSQR
jgi:hypothetical protein